MRPVKAQEEVGGLAVEEEISCPERNGEAMNGAAEVKRDPEVLGVSIYKDVLQDRTGSVWSEPSDRSPDHAQVALCHRDKQPQSSVWSEPPDSSPDHVQVALCHGGMALTGFYLLFLHLLATKRCWIHHQTRRFDGGRAGG